MVNYRKEKLTNAIHGAISSRMPWSRMEDPVIQSEISQAILRGTREVLDKKNDSVNLNRLPLDMLRIYSYCKNEDALSYNQIAHALCLPLDDVKEICSELVNHKLLAEKQDN